MKIIFEHSFIFDECIAELKGKTFDKTNMPAIEAFLPMLNELWVTKGNNLLSTACGLSGFNFRFSELKCTVFISDFVSGMSHPFILNIKKFLESPDSEILEETIFHEALHILLTDNWKVWPTELVKKYGGSNPEIEAHLHH